MKTLKKILLILILILTASNAKASVEAEFKSKLGEATKNFKDLTMDIKITFQNQKELALIGKDYGTTYKFDNTRLIFKSPDKFRMTARSGLVNVNYVTVGNTKYVRAGAIRQSRDLSKAPHKRQSALDAGIVDLSLWNFYGVDSVRKDTLNGVPVYVVTYHWTNSPNRKHLIWVDARDMRLLRRERREADGSLIARYIYSNHKVFPGIVIVPGEVAVYNEKGNLAGRSVYSNIAVNTGVKDSEFN